MGLFDNLLSALDPDKLEGTLSGVADKVESVVGGVSETVESSVAKVEGLTDQAENVLGQLDQKLPK